MLTQAEVSKSLTRVDKGRKVEMQDSFAAWMELYDEMDALQERRRPTRRDLEKCMQRHKAKWNKQREKKEATADEAWW